MSNYFKCIFITAAAAVCLCGCEKYQPSNAPRETVTMKSNILTTVTTYETTRADTYSEYISSLEEAGEDGGYSYVQNVEHVRISADTRPEAALPDTAISAHPTETMQRITAAPNIDVTIVTTAPPDEETETSTSTVVCGTEEQELFTEYSTNEDLYPEFPAFDLHDIPPVPSEAVKADTALTNP